MIQHPVINSEIAIAPGSPLGYTRREASNKRRLTSACVGWVMCMRVMGVDCGSQYTGYAVVEQQDGGELHCLAMGAVRLATGDPLEVRLLRIFQELSELISAHHPEVVAIEDVFHAANAKSALKLGHVRGVAMLAAAQAGLPVVAYAPLSVKSAVVGYGRA